MCSFRIKQLWSYTRLMSFLLRSSKRLQVTQKIENERQPSWDPRGGEIRSPTPQGLCWGSLGQWQVTGHRTPVSRMGPVGSGRSSRITVTPGDKGPSLGGGAGKTAQSYLAFILCSYPFSPIFGKPTDIPQGVGTDCSLLGEGTSDFCSIVNKLALSALSSSRDPWSTLWWQPAIFCSIQHVYFFIVIHVWVSLESNYCISLVRYTIWRSC